MPSSNLQSLIDVLERGGYEAVRGELMGGSPLEVESLEPVMRCVTFEDPGTFRRWAKRCVRLSKIARFFRIHSWSHMFGQAAFHFEGRADRAMIRLHKV